MADLIRSDSVSVLDESENASAIFEDYVAPITASRIAITPIVESDAQQQTQSISQVVGIIEEAELQNGHQQASQNSVESQELAEENFPQIPFDEEKNSGLKFKFFGKSYQLNVSSREKFDPVLPQGTIPEDEEKTHLKFRLGNRNVKIGFGKKKRF